jgi:hypothetical protein
MREGVGGEGGKGESEREREKVFRFEVVWDRIKG